MPVSSELDPMVRKLHHWRALPQEDQDALLALPYRTITLRPHEHLVREGDRPPNSCLILSGFAIRHKVAGNGGRQIFSIHMRGDLADLQNSLLGVADHNLQALTALQVALIPAEAVQRIAFERPEVGRAMWYETLVDGSIFREWTLNVGRRDGLTRTAHLLCEYALRLEKAGLGQQMDYELPMTQEQLGDALALTPVHVNRMLMSLADKGLIERRQRAIKITDWHALVKVGDFDPTYLHLDGDNKQPAWSPGVLADRD
jgi:CRP-like cAMP-binding protein